MARYRPRDFTPQQNAFISTRNLAVKEARGGGVHVVGLAEVRQSLRLLDRDAARDMQKGLRVAMKPVTSQAKTFAPHRSGKLAGSLRPFAAGNSVGVRSRLPYANVQHWGGSTGRGHKPGVPWSGSIFVRPTFFVSEAIRRNEDKIVDAVGDVIEQHAMKMGWR